MWGMGLYWHMRRMGTQPSQDDGMDEGSPNTFSVLCGYPCNTCVLKTVKIAKVKMRS